MTDLLRQYNSAVNMCHNVPELGRDVIGPILAQYGICAGQATISLSIINLWYIKVYMYICFAC